MWAGSAVGGHRSILEKGVAREPTFIMSLHELLPLYKLGRGFAVYIPERKLWQQQRMAQVLESVWYTDGSRKVSGTGVGF